MTGKNLFMNINPKIKSRFWFTISFFIITIFVPTTCFSSNISLSASVDKNHLTTEDSLELSIKISGIKKPPTPELPPLSNFTVRSTGTQSSTQIINSNMQVSTVFNYLLIPKSVGTFTIGSIEMVFSGTVFKSNPITLTIENPGSNKSVKKTQAYAQTNISKTNPYINEQVVYTFKFFRKTETRNLNLRMPYDESFFRKEDLGKAKRYSTVIGGIAYDVDEISIALFPTKIGLSTIQPAIMEVDLIYRTRSDPRRDSFARFFNDPFFGGTTKSTHKILSTEPIETNIRPLPEKGKPKNFKDLVGQFDISSTIGKDTFDAGDTTTLTINVSGVGNVTDVSLKNLNLNDDFKVYSDQPKFTKSIHGNQAGGEKVFKFALVPFSSGKLTIPKVSISYFDPEKNKYETVSTKPINLTIKPKTSTEKLNLVQSKKLSSGKISPTVSILARDILPIHTRPEDFESVTLNQNHYIIYMISFLLPFIIYLLSAGHIQYKHKINEDISYSRRQTAHRKASIKLEKLSFSNLEAKDFLRELSQIIREYIGDKINLQGTAFTSNEVEEKLKKNSFAKEKISAVKQLLEKCESMQYTPLAIDKDHGLINETTELLIKLEK